MKTRKPKSRPPSMRRVDVQARERIAFDMTLAGRTCLQVATVLGVDHSAAWRMAEREARRRGLRIVRYHAVRVEPVAVAS